MIMKKVLLLSLALSFTVFVFAQRNYVVKPEFRTQKATMQTDNKVGIEPIKSYPITSSRFVQPPHAVNRDVTIMEIGHSANAYGYGYAGGQKAILWADNELNTFINLHREVGGEPNYSGNLNIDISYNRGGTFTNDVRVYTSNISGGTYNTDAARYPQGGIYNPVGNTNLANAYYEFEGANLDGTNGADSWGGYSYGRVNLDDLSDTTKHLRSSDPANGIYQYIPDGFHVTHQGVALLSDLNQDWTSGSLVWLNQLLLSRGLWNSATNDFDFDRFLIDCVTLPDAGRPAMTRCAFGPDGQTGYVVALGDDGSVPFSQGAEYPIVYKTTDAGETWEDPVGVELGGPDGIDAIVYDWFTDQQLLDFFGEPVPARDEILYTTAFDCDIVVDAFNNPHIAVVIGIGDGAYAIYTPADYIAVWDVTSYDGGQTWTAYNCGTLTTFRGTFGDLTEDNRVNASIDEGGTKVFISWLDTHFEGVTDNIQPDIFIRGIDYSNFLMTEDVVNVTEYTEGWLQAYFFVAPYYVFEDGGTYTIPFVYEDMDPADPTQPVTFMFVNGYTVTGDDFVTSIPHPETVTANAGPNATICEGETYTLSGTATNYTSVEWTTSGDGTFDDPNTLAPVYTPGEDDIANGSVTLTLTAYSGSNQASDDMMLTIEPLPGIPATPAGPDTVDYYEVQSSEFTTAGATNADSYMWDLQPSTLGTITGTTTTATVDWNGSIGIASITVKAVNACGESAFSDAWTVVVRNTTGIGDVQNKDVTIRIIPNPNSGEFIMELASKENSTMNLRIMDALGNIVYSQNGIQVNQKVDMKLSLDNLKKGVYFILVNDGKTTQAKKLVIQK
jgi:hypothetical protein